MKSNPSKPRLWREDKSVEAFVKANGDAAARIPDAADRLTLTGMNTSEAAVFLVEDCAVRDELLASLEGRKKTK